jgi:hypothetical protein
MAHPPPGSIRKDPQPRSPIGDDALRHCPRAIPFGENRRHYIEMRLEIESARLDGKRRFRVTGDIPISVARVSLCLRGSLQVTAGVGIGLADPFGGSFASASFLQGGRPMQAGSAIGSALSLRDGAASAALERNDKIYSTPETRLSPRKFRRLQGPDPGRKGPDRRFALAIGSSSGFPQIIRRLRSSKLRFGMQAVRSKAVDSPTDRSSDDRIAEGAFRSDRWRGPPLSLTITLGESGIA